MPTRRALLSRTPRRVASTACLCAAMTLGACTSPEDDAPAPGAPDEMESPPQADMTGAPDLAGEAEEMSQAPPLDAGAPALDVGDDAPPDDMASGEEDMSGMMMGSATKEAHCDALRAELQQAQGAVLEISPAGPGEVTLDGRQMTLRQAVSRAEPGDTVLLADGTYTFPANEGAGVAGGDPAPDFDHDPSAGAPDVGADQCAGL